MYVIYVLTVACLSASWQVEAKSCNLISYQLLPRVIFIWPLKMVSVKCSLFVLSVNGWKNQNMDSSFSCQGKP